MRLHFQERPWDLYLAEGYVAAMAAFILVTGQGLLVAILMVLFIPGYALVAALFPEREAINWIERIALSFGLSIAVVPLLGLGLNFTPYGFRLVPIVLSILVFSEGVGFVAYLRRMKLPVEKRLSASLEIGKPAWQEFSALDKALALGLAISVLFSVSVLAYVIIMPPPGERFTEFYLLGPEGRAENYPKFLNVSEEGTVLLGVANHEFERMEYTVRVDLVGVQLVGNETEVVEVNRTNLAWINLTLDHDENWTRSYAFRIDGLGLWKVQFLLFRDGDLTTVYRNVHLIVRVEAL